MIGSFVGQYEVRSRLGEGGMGVVYRAVHRVLHTERAVKVLQPEWTAYPDVVQRFINEARAAAAIRHRNIIGVHDCGQLPGGEWYILLDYLEGGTLTGFLRSQGGPIPLHDTLHILAQAANGIHAAHQHDIIHRDLKPDNLFLSQRDDDPHFVTILDFGVAKLGEQRRGKALTSAGMILGTPAYMAPEQMRGEMATPASDVFALGVIAYQMVTGGKLPFERDHEDYHRLDFGELARRMMTSSPLDPRARSPHLPEAWSRAILAALQPHPEARPASTRAFALALAEATPGDGYSPDGVTIIRRHASELLSFGATEVTARAATANERSLVAEPQGTRGGSSSLSRYRLDERVGVGGMAEVFRGTASGADGFSRPVAVKRVLAGFAADPRFAEMFISEAQLAAGLHHPNIVSVLDFDRDEQGRPFLVMEYVDGKDLAELATLGPVPAPVAIFIAIEVLRGLGYAHRPPPGSGLAGLVHRDVSPHNVLLSWEGAVKVSDFGIAKAVDDGGYARSEVLKGKASYMSPEQANAEPIDGRADLFAVGIVLWELLTGRRLFGGTSTEALARVFHAPIRSPKDVIPEVAVDVSSVVLRLLARDRQRRFRYAEEAIEALTNCRDCPRNGPAVLATALAERFSRPTPRAATDPAPLSAPVALGDDATRSLRAPSIAPEAPRNATPYWRKVIVASALLGLLALGVGLIFGRESAAPASAPSVTRQTPVAVDASLLREPPDAPSVDAPAVDAMPVAAAGTLVIDVVPWATIWIDGKAVGQTPYRGKLAPGRYRLRLRNAKREKTLTVSVRAGKTTAIYETLDGTHD